MLGWFRRSIKAKAMGAMVSVVLLSLVLTLFLGSFLIFTFLREQARDDVSQGLQDVYNLYEVKCAELLLDIRLLTSQPTLVGYVQDHDHSHVLYMVNPILHKAEYDILDVIDEQGAVLARAHDPSQFGDSVADRIAVQRALAGETDVLLQEVGSEEGVDSWSLQAFAPLRSRGSVVGAVMGGWNIDDEFASQIKGLTDREVVFTIGDTVIASTAEDGQGDSLTHTLIPTTVWEHVLSGDTFVGEVSMGGIRSVVAFAPLYGQNGEILGSIGVVQPLELAALLFNRLTLFLCAALIFASLVAAIVAWRLAGRITRPIKQLTEATQLMTAEPLLAQTQEVTVTAEDEVGQLSEAFYDMSRQIRQRIWQEQHRADQLRAINEVGRKISSILSLDELLPYVADLLRDSFNYYNVNIFLLDPGSEHLVLRGGAGGYKGAIPIGSTVKLSEGIVGWVVQTGEPLLANDVSKEPKYLFVKELADTRSELAVPIKVGAETLGVLDIESAEIDAFDETDLSTAQTLADQLAIAIENARLYQETRQMAVIEERNRMAREIHDTLAQGFTGIVLQLEAAEQALGEDLGAAQQHLDRARSLARDSLNEARRSVWGLRPGALEQLPLVEALAQEIERFTRQSGVKANFNISEGSCRLPEDVEAALLRICQESLANVRKHAQASEVDVNLIFEESAVRLSLRDNGVGFDPQALPEGTFGLIGMRERARLLGGEFVVQSEKGRGVLIQATIPIRRGERSGAY